MVSHYLYNLIISIFLLSLLISTSLINNFALAQVKLSPCGIKQGTYGVKGICENDENQNDEKENNIISFKNNKNFINDVALCMEATESVPIREGAWTKKKVWSKENMEAVLEAKRRGLNCDVQEDEEENKRIAIEKANKEKERKLAAEEARKKRLAIEKTKKEKARKKKLAEEKARKLAKAKAKIKAEEKKKLYKKIVNYKLKAKNFYNDVSEFVKVVAK